MDICDLSNKPCKREKCRIWDPEMGDCIHLVKNISGERNGTIPGGWHSL